MVILFLNCLVIFIGYNDFIFSFIRFFLIMLFSHFSKNFFDLAEVSRLGIFKRLLFLLCLQIEALRMFMLMRLEKD